MYLVDPYIMSKQYVAGMLFHFLLKVFRRECCIVYFFFIGGVLDLWSLRSSRIQNPGVD